MFRFWLRLLGAVVVEFALAGAMLGILVVTGLEPMVLRSYGPSMLFAGVLGLLLTAAVVVYAQTAGALPLGAFGFTWDKRQAVYSILSVLVIFALGTAYMLALHAGGFRSIGLLSPNWPLIGAAVIGSLSVLHEEVLSRGYLLGKLRTRYSTGAALLISALLFTAIHLPTRGFSFLVVTWFLMGLVYGYVYLKSGSLWSALAVHAAHNFILDLLMYSGNGVSLLSFDPALGAVGHLPFRLILSVVVVAGTYWWFGPGTPFLAPHPTLVASWEAEDPRNTQMEQVPV